MEFWFRPGNAAAYAVGIQSTLRKSTLRKWKCNGQCGDWKTVSWGWNSLRSKLYYDWLIFGEGFIRLIQTGNLSFSTIQ